jgi:pyruvate dehydrogenase E2 component (dihydrolipoamide acetyltransferase)
MPYFRLPDLGDGVTDADIDRWLVSEGDVIEEDVPLVDVITDKASAEIPSPFAGTVTKIHVKAGEIVPVGTVLVTVVAEGEVGPPTSEPVLAPLPEPVGTALPPPPPAIPVPEPLRATATPERSSSTESVKAMPPVRKLAGALGVDLANVTGSGPNGRVTREDVEAAARDAAISPAPPLKARPSEPSIVPPAPVQIPPGGKREPLRGVRRRIAERMSHAHLTVAPVTHVEECDVTELEATRRLANERAPELQKLTYMPFIVKAVTTCLKQFPALNASLDDDAHEIVFHDRLDIGIAIDTPAGLTVGVVKEADRLRLREIATEIERLAGAAREGRLTPDDIRNPTFTISSPGGDYGGLLATPIVFHPQSAILGVHRAKERPVAIHGQVVIRKMMNLSVTFDHRILDGMTAARFILDVIKLLEHPAVLALES